MSENISFSKRLQELVDFIGVNQNQIAKKSGVSPSSFGKALNGSSLSLDNVIKILKEFPVDANWLLLGMGSPERKPLAFANEVEMVRHIKENPEIFSGLKSFEELNNRNEMMKIEEMVDRKIAALKKEIGHLIR